MAQIPDMFHSQKEYCFRAMEQDAFPRFLRSKAFGNLTPISALVRLIAGLVILWIGLAVAFALVFLDVEPKSKRFFVSVFSTPPSAVSDDPTAVPSVHRCDTLPDLTSIRAGPDPRLLWAVRDHAVPHTHDARAVREEAAAWKGHLGVGAGSAVHDCVDVVILGRAWL